MQVRCTGAAVRAPKSDDEHTVSVTGSTLTMDGSSVVVSFVGTMPAGSGCVGAETAVSLLCAK